jgi:PAS domain S-box-containing protein
LLEDNKVQKEQTIEQLEKELAAARQRIAVLESRETELTDFIENAVIGLHWVAEDGKILWANQAELDLLGYTKEEYIGHYITEFHADLDVITDILTRLIANESLHSYEARLKCKDGSIRTVLISSNVLWKDGKFIHTRCFTRDITDRKRIEIQLQEQKKIAEEANRIKDEFLAMVSHELRTPLTSMLGWVRLLRTGNLGGATATRAIETIERNVKSQAQLIEDLLDISRIVSGKFRLEPQPIELDAIINLALDTLRP